MTKRQRIAALEESEAYWMNVARERAEMFERAAAESEARRLALVEADKTNRLHEQRIAELEAQLADKTAKLSEEAQRSIRLGEQVIANDEAWQEKYDAAQWWSRTWSENFDEVAAERDAAMEANDLLIAVGDQYLPTTGLAARAWAAAKEGRPLRGPDGRFTKTSGVAS